MGAAEDLKEAKILVRSTVDGQILHQLVGSLSHYLQGFIHPRWLFGILSTNSSI